MKQSSDSIGHLVFLCVFLCNDIRFLMPWGLAGVAPWLDFRKGHDLG